MAIDCYFTKYQQEYIKDEDGIKYLTLIHIDKNMKTKWYTQISCQIKY